MTCESFTEPTTPESTSKTFGLGEAIERMKAGGVVRRELWESNIYIDYHGVARWILTADDTIATDWYEVGVSQ